MEQLPKIVQNRLQASAARVGDHPDPDLLAAFAEQSLDKRERLQVMEHLAACAECREVVSLAQPEVALSPAGLVPAPRGTWRWPLLRWGAVVACVVVVGAAVSLRQWSGKRAPATPYSDASAVPERTSAVKAPAGTEAPQARLQAEIKAQPALEADRQVAEQVLAKKLDRAAVANGRMTAGSAGARNQPASHMAELAVAPSPSPPASQTLNDKLASEQGKVGALRPAAPQFANETAAADAKAASRDEIAQVIPGKAKDAEENKLRAKESVAVSGLTYSTSAATKTEALYRADNKVIPRWMVSPNGTLQRSDDAGKTWQTLPLASNVVLRTVATVAFEVWAGGAAGALYHSTDLGQHWTRVKPTANGSSLTSDIVTIEFVDLQHVRLTTATGETWITADGGQNWQKK